MPSTTRTLPLLTAFAMLLLLAAGVGCKGFFVNPTLTSLAIGPQTPTLAQGQSLQMTATGTYDDGSTKNLTGSSTWSSSDTTCATINSGGLITAAQTITAICTTSISASSGTVSASPTTLTVTPGPLQSITLAASTTNPTAGTTITFTATGTYSGGTQQDITAMVTWNNDNTTALTLSQGSGSATVSSGSSGQTANVFASLSGINSNTVTITVQ
jgi:trimeric autotransporter adhesin